MEAGWVERARWRMRGAWLWPTFVALTFADGVLLTQLPLAGDGHGSLFPALLLAGFANLMVVAVITPLAARPVRRRRPDLPKPIAENYTGTALVCVMSLAFLVGGLIHRPERAAARRDLGAALTAANHYVIGQAPEYRAGLHAVTARHVEPELYEVCVPGRDPDRRLCLLVNTDQSPPGVRRGSFR